jgi:LysM repeat protein
MTQRVSMTSLGNGVNLQPSYYGDVHFGWELMKSHSKIQTVRIEIEPNKATEARGWIQQACSHGFNVIATYHKFSVLGTNNPAELAAAAAWWSTNYSLLLSAPAFYTVQPGDTLWAISERYYGHGRHYNDIYNANRDKLHSPDLIYPNQRLTIPAKERSFIINMMNEWGDHTLQARDYANANNAAIAGVRAVYDGPIVIDAPGWGQETAVLASAVKGYETGGVSLQDSNIALSVHIYRQAHVGQRTANLPGGAMNTNDLDDLATAHRPCIIGEFGPGDAPTRGAPAPWSALVDHAKSKNWPVLGWAWNGDGGTMNMVTPAWSSDRTASVFRIGAYFSTIYDKL